MDRSLLLSFLLLLSFSLQIHARESQFFAKTSRSEPSPKLSTSMTEQPSTFVLPPQSHNGYGLYGRDTDQFPSAAAAAATSSATNYNYNSNNVADTIPSSFTNAEFSTERHENNNPASSYKEPNTIPSSFTNAEFSTERHENNNPASSFTTTEYYSNANDIPSTFSNEEFNRGGYATRVANYPNYDKQYGMSDTRFLENGKYFYDVNAEGNRREYEQMKGNSERYGNGYNEYTYKNEMGGYQNSQENMQESQEEYVP